MKRSISNEMLLLELVFIGSAHVFSANFPAELRQISLQYDSIPADIFLVSIKIMLKNPHTLPMNTSSQCFSQFWLIILKPEACRSHESKIAEDRSCQTYQFHHSGRCRHSALRFCSGPQLRQGTCSVIRSL